MFCTVTYRPSHLRILSQFLNNVIKALKVPRRGSSRYSYAKQLSVYANILYEIPPINKRRALHMTPKYQLSSPLSLNTAPSNKSPILI